MLREGDDIAWVSGDKDSYQLTGISFKPFFPYPASGGTITVRCQFHPCGTHVSLYNSTFHNVSWNHLYEHNRKSIRKIKKLVKVPYQSGVRKIKTITYVNAETTHINKQGQSIDVVLSRLNLDLHNNNHNLETVNQKVSNPSDKLPPLSADVINSLQWVQIQIYTCSYS